MVSKEVSLFHTFTLLARKMSVHKLNGREISCVRNLTHYAFILAIFLRLIKLVFFYYGFEYF